MLYKIIIRGQMHPFKKITFSWPLRGFNPYSQPLNTRFFIDAFPYEQTKLWKRWSFGFSCLSTVDCPDTQNVTHVQVLDCSCIVHSSRAPFLRCWTNFGCHEKQVEPFLGWSHPLPSRSFLASNMQAWVGVVCTLTCACMFLMHIVHMCTSQKCLYTVHTSSPRPCTSCVQYLPLRYVCIIWRAAAMYYYNNKWCVSKLVLDQNQIQSSWELNCWKS